MQREKLIDKIIDALREQNLTVSFAESCTGGLLASEFTRIVGVSDVFNASMVTYSNEIKHRWLGVQNETLEKFGAVSYQCVEEMLKGIKDKAASDIAIAISGIAGPGGGSIEKPVGTVYIGILSKDTRNINHCLFMGTRNDIQESSVDFALELIKKELNIHLI
jgi:nicotinamide-nucleotide amidase